MEPIDPESPKAYNERYIHSEIYRRFPDVKAAVHSDTESVILFIISGTPLKPCYHMAGFLATNGVTVHDSADDVVASTDVPDLLVHIKHMGQALAKRFDSGNKVILSRDHTRLYRARRLVRAL